MHKHGVLTCNMILAGSIVACTSRDSVAVFSDTGRARQ